MANTPENCTTDERTMGDLESSYKKMFTDHIASHHCHEKGKFHESIIHVAIFQIKNNLRLTRLGTVLKLYQILLAKTQQKDKPGTKLP